MARCRKCGSTDVRWVRMEGRGNWNLLDSEPSDAGDIAVVGRSSGKKNDFAGITVKKADRDRYREAGSPLHASHFLTCTLSPIRERLAARRSRRQERHEQRNRQGSLI